MKERPILFNSPMVRAILYGRKTQTRRVIKPHPTLDLDDVNDFDRIIRDPEASKLGYFSGTSPYRWSRHDGAPERTPCPFGQIGDRLWVRETWSDLARQVYPHPQFVYRATDSEYDHHKASCRTYFGKDHRHGMDGCLCDFRWYPSIHMPRTASRLSLEVTSVLVRRIQDISPHDALAEGVNYPHRDECTPDQRATDAFRSLWCETYPNWDGKNWDQNPWVWVIEFRRIT